MGGELGGNGSVCMYGWVPLLFIWNYHNLVNMCWSLLHIQLFATPWTVARQTPLSMGFSRPEYWSGLPFPSPGDLPNPGVKQGSPALQVDSSPSEPPAKPLIGYTPVQNKKLKKCPVSELAGFCLLPEQDISPRLSSLYHKGSPLPGPYHTSHWQACRVAGGGEGCLVRLTQSPGDGFTCEGNPSSDRMAHLCGSSLFCPVCTEDPLLPPQPGT